MKSAVFSRSFLDLDQALNPDQFFLIVYLPCTISSFQFHVIISILKLSSFHFFQDSCTHEDFLGQLE